MHGCGGAGGFAVVVMVVVVVSAAAVVVVVSIGSFGCRISYRNSGIIGTETKKTTNVILGYETAWYHRW
jgi:hypothetical protein